MDKILFGLDTFGDVAFNDETNKRLTYEESLRMIIEEGKLAARQVGLTMLSTIVTNFGSLNKVKRVIKVLGMVNCNGDFLRHPYVINGCSELFAEVWGQENGIGVRSAVGMGSLPDNIPVEIEAVFELF